MPRSARDCGSSQSRERVAICGGLSTDTPADTARYFLFCFEGGGGSSRLLLRRRHAGSIEGLLGDERNQARENVVARQRLQLQMRALQHQAHPVATGREEKADLVRGGAAHT